MSDLEKQFNDIVSDYTERLWWHVRRMVNSHEDADDLLQEIFLKIWAALPSFRGESQLFTWVWRIATNETLNFLRRESRRPGLTALGAEAERRIDSDPWFDGTSAERELAKAVARLPDRQRQVFTLRYWDDLPFDSIAAITGLSTGALKASYHIARKKVEKFLLR